jgi:hypothetical protein
LLVFGQEAKLRIWLVVDGNDLYVDRNGNGDLTEVGKKMRFGRAQGYPDVLQAEEVYVGAIAGKDRYGDLLLRRFGHNSSYSVRVKVEKRPWSAPGYGTLRFADKASEAPIIHFDGPLTFKISNEKWFVESLPGPKPAELEVLVGCAGIGKGTFARLPARDLTGAKPLAELTLEKGPPIRFFLKPDG